VFNNVSRVQPGLRVEILGVNRISDAPYNGLILQSMNVLPWLQDTTDQAVWTRWQITYRDVLVLDSLNRPVLKDNLTSHDLGIAANRAALENALLQIANPGDTDSDGLPDDWEMGWFGDLTLTATGDADQDGATNYAEFAFATSPIDPSSQPSRLEPVMVTQAGMPVLSIRLRRHGGAIVTPRIQVETSQDLVTWTGSSARITLHGAIVNLYDGLGGAEARYRLTPDAASHPNGYIRVLLEPP
jgi:hypothetical protein